MRKLIFFTLLLFCLTPAFSMAATVAKTLKKETFVNVFQVDIKDTDKILKTQSSNLTTGILISNKVRVYLFAQQHRPQSVNSIKIRAQELSVAPEKIKMIRTKGGTIFYFEDEKYTYFYSTQGGKLLIGKNNKEVFDPTRVQLKTKKQSKDVASL